MTVWLNYIQTAVIGLKQVVSSKLAFRNLDQFVNISRIWVKAIWEHKFVKAILDNLIR